MAEIRNGEFVRNDTNQHSMGGTERLTEELANRLDKDLLKDFQIVSSRVRELQEDKIRVFWSHDLPGDPESEFLRTKTGQNQFHFFVFVSNWQMQSYINEYKLPWSKCCVIKNSIVPIEQHEKPDDGIIRFIYTSTPHRGLNVLVATFEELCKKYDNIELDVYSSFKIYGWEERDVQYKPVFDKIEQHEKMNNYGTVSNKEIREALKKSHVFAYPSIWPETSCLSLIEAMSAGCVCVHSNYGALFETSRKTLMYQYQEDLGEHASELYRVLDGIIGNWKTVNWDYIQMTRAETNLEYSWDNNINTWRYLLLYLKSRIDDTSIPHATFEYNSLSR